MNMPRITLLIALCLIVIGLVGCLMSGAPTSLIPTGIGVLSAICGIVAVRKEDLRMHAMHGAALLGLLIIMGTASSVQKYLKLIGGEDIARPLAVKMQVLVLAISVLYMIFAIKSFIDARRLRKTTLQNDSNNT